MKNYLADDSRVHRCAEQQVVKADEKKEDKCNRWENVPFQ